VFISVKVKREDDNYLAMKMTMMSGWQEVGDLTVSHSDKEDGKAGSWHLGDTIQLTN
jgi:hypothetical protein